MFIAAAHLLQIGCIYSAVSYRIWRPSSVSSHLQHSSPFGHRILESASRHSELSTAPYRFTTRRMIWCYPIFGDDPNRKSRRKVDKIYERGTNKVNISLPYEYANRLAQNQKFVPFTGLLPYHPEEGLGRTEDVYTPPEKACGEVDIDPDEFDKIKEVYSTFDDNGCGVLKILGAKGGHFSFKYCGPLKEKYGIKASLTYMINIVYPGAKVTILTEKDSDEEKMGVDPWLFAKQRRLMMTGRDYMESLNDGLPHEMAYPKKFDMLI